MSWLTDLVSKKDNTVVAKSSKENNQLYISVDPTRVCFLLLDETVTPNRIISREEIALGPIEDLNVGEPVRDIFDSLAKVFAAHKEKFQDGKNISVSIPAEGVFFKNVEVPKINEPERQKLILAEIKKTLPVDFSQVLFAQNALGEKHDNMQSYLCVGIQKVIFENYKTLFAKFNLNPYFEIEVFSLARVVEADNKPKAILQVGRLNSMLIFLEGQIVQDVKLIELGSNSINKELIKSLGLNFQQAETLKANVGKLKDANRMGANIMDEYLKDFSQKMLKTVTGYIMEYEKKRSVEIQEVMISGESYSNKLKKMISDDFDAELEVDFINEQNFDEFVAENFSLDELKRFAQCFGLALRKH
jgi:Tfp pilus assembly PilM family ATPase